MEEHLLLDSNGCGLMAALHLPDEGPRSDVGIVLLHGWAGYRIGAHQMFVKLGRAAQERGYPCLRFDFRGRGDSEGDAATTTLTTMIADTRAAARTMLQRGEVKRLVLVGDCSGSEVAIGSGVLVDEAAALVLWSAPIVGASREGTDKAKRRDIFRQYWQKLFRPETWSKLVSGRLRPGMIKKALVGGGKGAGEEGSESDKDIDWLGRFRGFGGDLLFIYGSKDPTTEDAIAHFEALTTKAGRPWHCHLVEGANHAFYSVAWEREVIDTTLDWVDERFPAG